MELDLDARPRVVLAARPLEVDDPAAAVYPQGFRPRGLSQATGIGGFRRAPDHTALDRDAIAAARRKLAEVVSGREASIRIGAAAFATLLVDGRYKTLLETGRSLAPVDLSERADAEVDIFGYPADLDPVRRPVYGYLANPAGDPAGSILDVFGRNIRIVLREEVKDRATVTVGDTLATRQIGAPLRAVEAGSQDYALTRMCASENLAHAGQPDGEYIEIQIHGTGGPAVTTGDIARVEFIGKPPSALQQQLMTARGLAWATVERTPGAVAAGPPSGERADQVRMPNAS